RHHQPRARRPDARRRVRVVARSRARRARPHRRDARGARPQRAADARDREPSRDDRQREETMSLPTRIRRGAAALAVVAVAALAASCANPFAIDSGSGAAAERAPVLDGVPDELLEFYDQPPEWAACDEAMTSVEVECATITAPLDWNDPSAGEIELAISRPADRPAGSQGSLLVNPGGPGASGIDYLHQSLEYDGLGEPLLESFDVVGFDPRGVGRSTPVECLDAADMDAYLYDVPDAERGTPEWEDALTAGAETFADGCAEKSG